MPLISSLSTRSGSVSAEEQWNNWGSMERQGGMMKVVRSLQLNDPSGLFSRELDAETLEVHFGTQQLSRMSGSRNDVLWSRCANRLCCFVCVFDFAKYVAGLMCCVPEFEFVPIDAAVAQAAAAFVERYACLAWLKVFALCAVVVMAVAGAGHARLHRRGWEADRPPDHREV